MSTEHLLRPDEVAYRTCACEHCPEIAIGAAGAICGDCEAAGCTAGHLEPNDQGGFTWIPGDCEREDEIFADAFEEEDFGYFLAVRRGRPEVAS